MDSTSNPAPIPRAARNINDVSTENEPRKRLSNTARQQVADTLAAAYTDGQLSTAEFELRTAQVWGATYADETAELTADLDVSADLVAHTASEAVIAPRSGEITPHVTGEPGGISTSIAVMSGVDRSGDWLVAPHHFSLALMGGTELNLQNARFTQASTRINAAAVMGGVRIIVPEDVRVRSEGLALMGGFEVRDHESVSIAQQDLPDHAPTLTVSGIALMGGVEVVRAARSAVLD